MRYDDVQWQGDGAPWRAWVDGTELTAFTDGRWEVRRGSCSAFGMEEGDPRPRAWLVHEALTTNTEEPAG